MILIIDNDPNDPDVFNFYILFFILGSNNAIQNTG